MRKLLLCSLGVAATVGLLSASAHAASTAATAGTLFSPFETTAKARQALSADRSYQALAGDRAAASLQLVRAHADRVTAKTAALTLNLAPGVDLRAQRVDSYVSASGSLVWSGVVADPGTARIPFSLENLQFDPINTVILVKSGTTITGNVHFNGDWYKIRPLRSGGHAIVLVDPAKMPPDHPAEYARLPLISMPETSDQDKANTVIRVMVHYTPSAAAASGNISSLIDLAVAESNQGYTNSGVAITMQLATKAQVTYTESGSFSTDLSRYRGTADGFMDSIHTTRNTVTADVGLLVINNASSCGLASSIGSTASTAFATAHWDCITGYYSFAHEIGHLESARHDPANDPTTTPYAYGHGYQYTGSPSWRTIMAYNCTAGCPRLNYWSNPNNLYNGHPMGTAGTNDNARVLNNTRATVAAFR
jgi:hypothetical protein